MTIRVLTGLTIVSGILAIAGHYTEPPWIIYVFKPLTTILILVIALLSGADAPPAYRIAILVGLVFSLAGDVLLMLPSDQFMLGLVSFLIAQICYIIAFTSNRGFSFGWASLIPVVIYGAIVYALLAPHLGKMRLPVIAYMIVILVMARLYRSGSVCPFRYIPRPQSFPRRVRCLPSPLAEYVLCSPVADHQLTLLESDIQSRHSIPGVNRKPNRACPARFGALSLDRQSRR